MGQAHLEEGDADESCLREPVRILAELRLLSPQQANIMLYVQFIGKIDNNFLRLLSNRDKRALWALGYWLGLIGCLGMWWCDRRVLRDWTAIRDFLLQQDILEGEADDEKEMWQQLMEDYADVREIASYDTSIQIPSVSFAPGPILVRRQVDGREGETANIKKTSAKCFNSRHDILDVRLLLSGPLEAS